MKTIKSTIFSALAIATLTFTSCSEDQVETTEQQDLTAISEKLSNLGFDVEDLHATTFQGLNGFVVEGDIFLTIDQINELSPKITVGNNEVNSEHYRTNNIVSTPRTLSVYMDATFGSDMQAAFDEALSRYNALNLDITFARAANSGADIDVLAQKLPKYRGGTILGRSAGFPDASGNPATPIVLNSDIYVPRRGGVPADAVTVIAHEIGHAIGFRHTDYFDRSFSCGGSTANEGDGGVGAVYIPGTPSGAENGSFMLACSNGTDRPFTSGDRTALTTVY
ncbi:M57 family metalloprotease [Leeuwenhoekiella sp. H156]|uniref:M57 family metalloprotease n=1 Tax=Leeuwenhoekiella sp. H156 TaxID=3450128 RepID=UPI003FA44593